MITTQVLITARIDSNFLLACCLDVRPSPDRAIERVREIEVSGKQQNVYDRIVRLLLPNPA